MSSKTSKDVSSTVSKLPKSKPKKEEVADSWEDEDLSSGSDAEDAQPALPAAVPEGISAPSPTSATPTYDQKILLPTDLPGGYPLTSDSSSPAARPEKTDAVARRMIAAGLGLRVPRQTEEQKAYDKAVREKERKKREEEKAAQRRKEEEAAKAKAAVWDD
ncbi:hypothetical protein VPNG_03274 [Cytospora leucostoma]|uniref:Uncharacterized protein n=1 Tax=Cytospora leucostoma TaxID=1230097 RepID=A0A423XEU0_9PEZI|nr:hypothetical protein VPNG_03274 [Cytospora leucostoma]